MRWEAALQAVVELEAFSGRLGLGSIAKSESEVRICRPGVLPCRPLGASSSGPKLCSCRMPSCSEWLCTCRLCELEETDHVVWTCCIKACAQGRHWQQAVQLLCDALGRQLATLDGFNEAMSACSWPWALHLLDAMATQQLRPNSMSLTMLAASCGRGGAWQQVLRLHGDEILMACVAGW